MLGPLGRLLGSIPRRITYGQEVLAGKECDLKADVYSLGCVLFELVNLR